MQESKELVSIIIPYYNGGEYIKETLLSCANQTYSDLEIIIIDDCSPTPLNIDPLLYRNLKIYKNIENQGTIRTVNRGIEYAKGKYLICLGQDDILPSFHVEKMMKCVGNDVGFVYCGYKVINSEGKITSELQGIDTKNVDLFLLSTGNKLHSCGLLLNKEIAQSVGKFRYCKEYPNYGEWDLWIRMVSVARAVFCEDTYGLYRRHDENMTSHSNMIKNRRMLYKYNVSCRKKAKRLGSFNFNEKVLYHWKLFVYCLFYLVREVMIKLKLYQIYRKIMNKFYTKS